jgi:RNA polymerase sigma-70 factor (ECF subfamily)
MSHDEESDELLVRHFQGGDADAFDALVRRYQDRIYRMAAVWLYDGQHSSDVVQEVFLRAFKGLRAFRFRSAVFTWLYRTTRNVCREQNRRRTTDPLDFEPVDSHANPAAETERQYVAKEVRQLIASLPKRQQEVVLLRIFEDLSVRETAAAMKCREGTVKALLHKATTRLRSTLQTQGTNE